MMNNGKHELIAVGSRVKYGHFTKNTTGTITDIDEKDGSLIYIVQVDGEDHENWGYPNQFEVIK